jgi:hypothetical protein
LTQNSQVLSRSPTSANIPNQAETILKAEVREQIRRTEAKRARMASDAAQGAIPRGMVGVPQGASGGAVGGGRSRSADPRGDEDGITRPSPQGDRDRVEVAQITGPGKSCPKESPASRERSTAQGAGGMGPAHGQEPPEAAQGVQTSQGAGGMGPAHGQAPPEAARGVQMAQNSQVLSLTHTSADLVGSAADETENQVSKIPDRTETIHETEVRVREQFRRTESERPRMATAAAQGTTPCGMGGKHKGHRNYRSQPQCGSTGSGRM